jgi:peptide/nickel transport system permease protein
VLTATPAPAALQRIKSRSRLRGFFRDLRKNPGALIGLTVLVVLVLAALFAPLVTSFDPNKINPPARLQGPSSEHWFGTDPFGRDLYTRIVYGARVSLPVGFIAVAISAGFGVVLGMISGYYSRLLDSFIMRVMDIMLAFPGILLALVVVTILGPNLRNVMIAVGIGGIPRYTRLVRSSVLTSKELLYVEGARVIGLPERKILFRHVLPNVLGPSVVLSTISIGTAILSAAGLSFLGLGAVPPQAEWGSMLADGRQFLRLSPWVTAVPGIAIMITVLSVNLLGDGLRDILDPRMRQ